MTRHPETEREIEPKFLVRGTPSGTRKRMEQGYFTTEPPEVRVRITDGEAAELTLKGPDLGEDHGPAERAEATVVVELEKGRRMLALARGSVAKDRYVDGRWEVDVYHGDLEGLMVAEVELATADEPMPDLPDGLEIVRDVTHDLRFRNQSLALMDPEERRALVRDATARRRMSGPRAR